MFCFSLALSPSPKQMTTVCNIHSPIPYTIMPIVINVEPVFLIRRNKYANPDRALFCYKALNEVTRARKKCRVKPEPQTSVSPGFEFLSALDTLSQGCFTSFMRKFYLNLLKWRQEEYVFASTRK